MHSQLKLIWKLMQGQRLRYVAALWALLLSSVLLYVVPFVTQIAIDGVFNPKPQGDSTAVKIVEAIGGAEMVKNHLWLGALVIVAITLLAGFFQYLRGRWAAQASESVARRLRDDLYDQLQHVPVSYLDVAETGDLVQRCSSDVETFRAFLANQVVEIGRAIIMLAVPLPVMFALSPRMTLLSVVLIPVILSFSYFFFRKVKLEFTQVDEAEGGMTSTLQENLTGVRVVRAFARAEYESQKFGGRNAQHRDLNMRLFATFASFWSISDFICLIQQGLVLVVGGYWVMSGQLEAGVFFYFIMVVSMYLWPVRMMGRILSESGKALVAIKRIQEVLATEREQDPVQPLDLVDARGALSFEDVSFSHGENLVLDQLSFSVEAGETLALLGASGSGKTTIVQLLLRFYDPQQGNIYFDGKPLTQLNRKQVREQIAVVLQEPFLYSRTVRENIAVGRAGAEFQEILGSTQAACVHEAIERFDDGYDTVVGERGMTLSGGQRQRVALARALLDEPAVLVLDDALSAIDTQTEAKVLHALKERRGRHTTILVAHRLSTLQEADRILVLDRGQIVQQGNHSQLLAADGPYQRIWALQNELEHDLRHELTESREGEEKRNV